MGGYSPSRSGSVMSSGSPATTEMARDEARGVGQSVQQAGSEVAGTAAEQAKEVADHAGRQAQDLLQEVLGQAREQVRAGQQKAAEGLSSIAADLQEMADKGGHSGMASELARQVAARVGGVASWLRHREPDELLEELRTWARRRPGVFLGGAAVAGVVAGRLTGGAIATQRPAEAGSSPAGSLPSPAPVEEGSRRVDPVAGQVPPPPGAMPPPPGAMPPPPPGAMPPPPGAMPPPPGAMPPPPPGAMPPPPPGGMPPPAGPPTRRLGEEPGGPGMGYDPGGRGES